MKIYFTSTAINALLFCAGCDKRIISLCPKNELNKNVSIGAVVAISAIFACASSWYCLQIIFENYMVSSVFSIFWGAFILNLDRLLVSTISSSQGEKRFFLGIDVKASTCGIFARVFLASIISLTISHPLKLKIYEKDIDSTIKKNFEEAASQIGRDDGALIDTNFNKQSSAIATSIEESKYLIKSFQEEYAANDGLRGKTLNAMNCACYGLGSSDVPCSIKYGHKSLCEEATIQYKNATSKADGSENKISAEQINLKKLEGDFEKISIKRANSLEDLKKSRSDLLASYKKDDVSLAKRSAIMADIGGDTSFWGITITLLFLCVEVSPILAKVLSENGAYDIALSKEKERIESILSRGNGSLIDIPYKIIKQEYSDCLSKEIIIFFTKRAKEIIKCLDDEQKNDGAILEKINVCLANLTEEVIGVGKLDGSFAENTDDGGAAKNKGSDVPTAGISSKIFVPIVAMILILFIYTILSYTKISDDNRTIILLAMAFCSGYNSLRQVVSEIMPKSLWGSK